jgi:hypothetical protein
MAWLYEYVYMYVSVMFLFNELSRNIIVLISIVPHVFKSIAQSVK